MHKVQLQVSVCIWLYNSEATAFEINFCTFADLRYLSNTIVIKCASHK